MRRNRNRILTRRDAIRVLALFNTGLTWRQIGVMMHVSYNTARNAVKAYGLMPYVRQERHKPGGNGNWGKQYRKRMTGAKMAKAIELYWAGATQRKIAQELHVTDSMVRYALFKSGCLSWGHKGERT